MTSSDHKNGITGITFLWRRAIFLSAMILLRTQAVSPGTGIFTHALSAYRLNPLE